MHYTNIWIAIEELGKGGQGKVSRVRKITEFGNDNKFANELQKVIKNLGASVPANITMENFIKFRSAIQNIISDDNPINNGALKVLHTIEDEEEAEIAKKRIEKEISAMVEIHHPNLLEIIEHDSDDFLWYVSRYHPNGTLEDNKNIFKGNNLLTLKTIRPLVDGVKLLHENNCVHRDIKPQNIFLSIDNELILGDFGIIFFDDEQHTRPSKTFEKVGSKWWMPDWAHKIEIEKVNPSFDVFSLGKLIWTMISGQSYLPHNHFKHEEYPGFNLEKLFPEESSMKMVNSILEKCIVDTEKKCLPDAGELLEQIDDLISYFEQGTGLLRDDIERPCKICNKGVYSLYANKDNRKIRNFFGYKVGDTRNLKIFACSNCGHVQLFHCMGEQDPPAWKDINKEK